MKSYPNFTPAILSALLSLGLLAMPAQAQTTTKVAMPVLPDSQAKPAACVNADDWLEPTPPRHIYGDSWYVGTCGITVVLIASPAGHVLIDSAPAAAYAAVSQNIASLGVKLGDIKTILTTHEHHDHVGGIALFQQASGAEVLVRKPGLPTMQTGQPQANDPQYATLRSMPAVANLRSIRDAAVLKLAGKAIQNLPMPGHAQGGSGWSWRECQAGVCKTLVFADSLGAFTDQHYRYSAPDGLAHALQQSAERLARTRCDILLTGHNSASNMLQRLDGKLPLIQADACKDLAATGLKNLAKQVQHEQQAVSN